MSPRLGARGSQLPLLGWIAVNRFRQRNTLARVRANISSHYDLGNVCFSLWLDRHMAYTCAYFKDRDEGIHRAQEDKFDYLCRKLDLAPGERVLDVGCGWGGFLLHAAERYGATCVGITLIREQVNLARERVRAAGLEGRITIQRKDYRELASDDCFDKVVSVGMFEHVGRSYFDAFFDIFRDHLTGEGIGVLQTIGRAVAEQTNPWILRNIFPGAYFPTLAEIAKPMAVAGLVITDVENLRQHYALTSIAGVVPSRATRTGYVVDTPRSSFGRGGSTSEARPARFAMATSASGRSFSRRACTTVCHLPGSAGTKTGSRTALRRPGPALSQVQKGGAG